MAESVSCYFCKCDHSRVLYLCPRCNASYCSLKCYQHPSHLQCTESFCREWVTSTMRDDVQGTANQDNNPIIQHFKESFTSEDYPELDEHDHEDVLTDKKDCSSLLNLDATAIDQCDETDLNKQLKALGLNPDDAEQLLEALDDEDIENFRKLVASSQFEILGSAMEKCDQRTGAKVSQKTDCDRKSISSSNSSTLRSKPNASRGQNNCGSEPWYLKYRSKVRFLEDATDLPDISLLRNLSSLPDHFKVHGSVILDAVNILCAYCIACRKGGELSMVGDVSKSFHFGQEFDDINTAVMTPIYRENMDKTEIVDDLLLLLRKHEHGTPLWIFCIAHLISRTKSKKTKKRLEFLVMAHKLKPFDFDEVCVGLNVIKFT